MSAPSLGRSSYESRAEPYASTRVWAVDAGTVLIWLLLAGTRLTSVPTLDMDEAWFISWAAGEVHGADPLSGMTRYTGILPLLLLKAGQGAAPLLLLRGASLVCNGLALVLLWRMLVRLSPRLVERHWALPLLASLPAWLIFARSGIEVCSFGPLLIILGLYLLTLGTTWASVGGGLCWGLAAYNHIMAAFVPLSLCLSLWWVDRRLPAIPLRAVVTGFVLGFAPRLVAMAFYANVPLEGSMAGYSLGKALVDLLFVPWVLWDTLNGRPLYLRFVGSTAVPVVWYWLAALVFFWPWRGRLRALPREARLTLLASLAFAFLTCLAAPSLQTHYMLLPLIGLSVFLVQLGSAATLEDPARRHWVSAAAGVIVAANLFYVVSDYHLPWSKPEKLKPATFAVGFRSPSASNRDVVPKEQLIRRLERLGVTQVITGASTARPLQVLLSGKMRVAELPHVVTIEPRAALVAFYAAEHPSEKCVDLPGRKECFDKPLAVRKQYLIYRRRRTPS